MLHKNKITKIQINTDEWKRARMGKFTSSMIYKLMGEQYNRYVRQKVGELMIKDDYWEEMSFVSTEVDTAATRWGSLYESEAIQKFAEKQGIRYIVTRNLIHEQGSLFACTPDGLIVKRESPDGTEYEVETLEVKCPPVPENYLILFDCETPKDLKSAKKEYYWQVLDQMDNCGSLVGHFVAYHPAFKSGNMKHIVFNLMQPETIKGVKTFPLYEDIKLLRAKKAQAASDFNLLYFKLLETENV